MMRCGGCGRVLDEPSDTPVSRRKPCAQCGSTSRIVSVEAKDGAVVREGLGVRVRRLSP
jgi:rRNA maturation endonuclease Nob1